MAGIDRDWLAQKFFRIGEWEPSYGRPFGELERKYLWTLPVAVVVSLLSTALEGVGIGLLVPLLSLMLGADNEATAFAPLRVIAAYATRISPASPMLAIGGMMLGLVVLKNVVATVGGLTISRLDGHAGSDLRSMLARRLIRLPYTFFLVEESPALINTISSDSWRASEAIQLIYALASAFAAALVLSAFAAFANWKLFLIVVAGAFLARWIQQFFSKRVAKLSERVTESNRVLGERMLLLVDLSRLIRIFNQEDKEQRAFDTASDQVRQAMFDVERNSTFYGPMIETLLAALFVAVLIIAPKMNMTVPEILAFLVLQFRLQPYVMSINQSYIDLAALKGSTREVEWLLSNEAKPIPQGGDPLPAALDQPIRFDRVSYAYPYEEAPVIREASFDILPGSATALIGRSGAGKSTLINLLTRLLDPSDGRILHGDIDLLAIDPSSWRSKIAVAGQDIDLIEGTVADNIAYRMEGLSREAIEQAATIADAHDFISAMPGGYDAMIDSYGANLSGGQRQRISLARALVRKPDLLILDEATNAVDGISESVIMHLLQEHKVFHTAIVISHRRSTLSACQRGIVIEHGQVIETGDLRELDFYREMERWPDGEAIEP